MTRAETARAHFAAGCNCAQAVLLAFSDVTGLTEAQSLALSAPFGGGMAGMRGACGAVTGMMMAAGMVIERGDWQADPDSKKAYYGKIRALIEQFEGKNGTIVCGELLGAAANAPAGAARTPAYHAQRPCERLVGEAAEILSEAIGGK